MLISTRYHIRQRVVDVRLMSLQVEDLTRTVQCRRELIELLEIFHEAGYHRVERLNAGSQTLEQVRLILESIKVFFERSRRLSLTHSGSCII